MPKYFPGLSHSLVKTVKNKELFDKTGGAIAMVSLCFGNDTDCIVLVVKKMSGPTSGVTAELPGYTVNSVVLPSFLGKPGDELKLAALTAFDRVKQKFGVKWAKHYKVFEKDIEEIGAVNA